MSSEQEIEVVAKAMVGAAKEWFVESPIPADQWTDFAEVAYDALDQHRATARADQRTAFEQAVTTLIECTRRRYGEGRDKSLEAKREIELQAARAEALRLWEG